MTVSRLMPKGLGNSRLQAQRHPHSVPCRTILTKQMEEFVYERTRDRCRSEFGSPTF